MPNFTKSHNNVPTKIPKYVSQTKKWEQSSHDQTNKNNLITLDYLWQSSIIMIIFNC